MEFHISWKRQIQDNPEKAKSIYPGDGASESGGSKRQILEKAGFFMQPGCPRPPEYGKLCPSGIMVNSVYNMFCLRDCMGRGFTQFAFPDSGAPDTIALYSAFLNYKLADGKKLHVRQTECWCPVCDFFVMAERVETLSELENELSNLRNPDPAEEDMLAFVYPSIEDAIGEVLARIEWRLTRIAPAKCLHCGSTDIQRIPEGNEFIHPKTDERVLIVGRGWASADPWYADFTPEGDLIWSDTRGDRT